MDRYTTDAKPIPGLSEENRERLCQAITKLQKLTTGPNTIEGLGITEAEDGLKRVLRETLVNLNIALEEIQASMPFYDREPLAQAKLPLDLQAKLAALTSKLTEFREGKCTPQALDQMVQEALASLPGPDPLLEKRVWWPSRAKSSKSADQTKKDD